MPGALQGIRVIDFGQYIAGPLAAVMLGDEGADVIHVDPPSGPVWKHPSDAFFNRGKRRISLDLKSADGLATARKLIASADVVVENFRPGVMDRLGLGAKAMTGANQALVYCSLPGFAADDPRGQMRAWEGVLDAATENCIPRTGEPPPEWDWSRPTYSAVSLASNFGGFLGATGVVMALIARERTGLGQRVEVPLYDAMFTLLGHSGAYVNSRGLHPPNPIHGRGAGCFRCGDNKYVQFDTSSARHLIWFAREAGITTEWAHLLDLSKNRDPEVNKELHSRLRELFLTKSAAEWEEIGNKSGAAIGWARNVNEWIHTRHAQELEAVVQLNDPEYGPTWMAGLPVRLTETPGKPQGPRHLPDADHDAIVAELAGNPHPPRFASHPLPRGEGKLEPGLLSQREGALEPNLAHPLQGMKVLDLCLALAGPTCGRLLLEFGADVVKVQAPHAGVGGYLNRGKRSILLDLEPPESQQVFWGMAKDADVVLENFSPGTADRLGIGYEEVRARNPNVVYTSISCYGQIGAWRTHRGWERQGQAVAGIMERTGVVPAILGPYNLIDIGTGVLGTFATGLGLYHRVRTGTGQHVQASLSQTATYQQTPYMLDFKGYEATEPKGYEALGTAPTNRFYKASDRWFFLAAIRDDEKAALTQTEGLGGVDTAAPDAEETLQARFDNADAATWVERLTKAGVPAHTVATAAEVMVDPVNRRRGLSTEQDIEGVGPATMPGLSVHLSMTPMRLGDRCHQPGSDGAAILAEIGMSDQLEHLERKWMLQTHDLPSAWGVM